MIFKPVLVDLIINQRKTQTRRKVKPGVSCKYQPGKHYAVQPGRGQKQVDRILVTAVRQEPVGNIDHQDSLREGFENIGGFIEYWEALYDREMDMDELVWVISFELYRPTPKERKPYKRPPKDWVHLLANQHGRKDAGNYTTSHMAALPDEPEAIDPVVVEKLPASMEARQRWIRDRSGRLRDRQELTPGQLLDAYLVDAKNHHIDVHGPLREIERQTGRIARRVDKAA